MHTNRINNRNQNEDSVEKKISLLEELIQKTTQLNVESADEPDFKEWQNLVDTRLKRIFGENSNQVNQFYKLNFSRNSLWMGTSPNKENVKNLNNDIKTVARLLRSSLEELQDEIVNNSIGTSKRLAKVFISHATADKKLVEEIIELLEAIGLSSKQIFCTSFSGYGIELGEDFLERIKRELNDEVLVIFVLSENFYKSPVCLCEMGATWVRTNQHIPILVPPLDFEDVKGVIPMTQGFKINDESKFNSFKDKIMKEFGLGSIDDITWGRKKDRAIRIINSLIS